MSGGKIKKCTCAHKDQDKMYGRDMRVHTIGGTPTQPTYKCTVCGKSSGK